MMRTGTNLFHRFRCSNWGWKYKEMRHEYERKLSHLNEEIQRNNLKYETMSFPADNDNSTFWSGSENSDYGNMMNG